MRITKLLIISALLVVICCSNVYSEEKIDLEKAAAYFEEGLLYVEDLALHGRGSIDKDPDYKLKSAIKYFEQAKNYAPSIPDVYYNLGLLYYQIEDYKNAKDNFERYLQLAQSNDSQLVKSYMEKSHLMLSKIEMAKKVMLNESSWFYLSEEPPAIVLPTIKSSIRPFISTTFRLSRDGQMYVLNPDLLPNVELNDPLREKYAKKQRWLKVTFNGRFFEYGYISLGFTADDYDKLDPTFIAEGRYRQPEAYVDKERPYSSEFWNFLQPLESLGELRTMHLVKIIKGEIKFDGDKIIIIQTNHVFDSRRLRDPSIKIKWTNDKEFYDFSEFISSRIFFELK
jgi:tetratricopeptide (TPR) repeat protein